jgi:uncharacterized protein with NRDE domain
MCSIAWRWCPGHTESLILISNRDEFYARPTKNAAKWPGTNVWAGKDQRAGGTWLGVTDSGRLAAITNYRSPDLTQDCSASRGKLVMQFLESDLSCQAFLDRLSIEFGAYNPFNLMVYDGCSLLGFEGRSERFSIVELRPGFGSVSNADFNTPWFKQTRLQSDFEKLLKEQSCENDELLDILLDDQVVPFSCLPKTGIPIEIEVALSALFVRMQGYGTRASSLVRIRDKEIVFIERGFNSHAKTHQSNHLIPRR